MFCCFYEQLLTNGFFRNLLLNDKMNSKVWDLFHEPDRVRTMLGGKIQEESLRTYLFTYSHVYDSISLIKLSEMFELLHGTVHAIISKMIINEEIMVRDDYSFPHHLCVFCYAIVDE